MKDVKILKKRIKIFVIIPLLFLVLCMLNGCKNDNKELISKKEKIEKELDFLDTKIIDIMNNLNNISLSTYAITSEEISLESKNSQSSQSTQGDSKEKESSSSNNENKAEGQESSKKEEKSKNETVTNMEQKSLLDQNENDIDWKKIKNDIEVVNGASSIIILDLSSLNIDSTDILNFSSTLNNSILSIENENKVETLNNLAKLYSYIPKFSKSIGTENSAQNIREAKLYLMNAYSYVEQGDWNEIINNINNCDNAFRNIMNDIEYLKNKEQKVNKTYVLIKELQNSISYKDKKLFFVKYKNLIESINSL